MSAEAGAERRIGLATAVGPRGRSIIAGVLGLGLLGYGFYDLGHNIPELEDHIVSQTPECSGMGGLSYRSLRENADSLWNSPRHTLGDMLQYRAEIDCYRAARTNLDAAGLRGGLRSYASFVTIIGGFLAAIGGLFSYPRRQY